MENSSLSVSFEDLAGLLLLVEPKENPELEFEAGEAPNLKPEDVTEPKVVSLVLVSELALEPGLGS